MVRIYTEEFNNVIEDVLNEVLNFASVSKSDVDLEINFLEPNEIKRLNSETRGIDKVTDVLSFQNLINPSIPLKKADYKNDINFEDDSIILGEIYICKEQAVKQAQEYGHSIEREIAFLTCHGLLHLLGYDHETEEKLQQMNDLTEKILSQTGYKRNDNDFLEPQDSETDSINENTDFKSGFVSIIGKPNSGKSTLINTIVGEKVSIVSWKPQTTRNKILGIYNDKDSQIVFIDTPGLHKPRNVLGEFMMKNAETALEGVDCILYMVDAEKGFSEFDKSRMTAYLNSGANVVVAVNKTDHVTKDKIMEILTELNDFKNLKAIVPISALRNRNIEPLITEIKKLLTDNIKYYPDDEYTDKNMRFMVAEIIREKTLRLLDKEVPYGIGVEVREYTVKENGVLYIEADIICEKSAHKPIILGKNGTMIKKISTYARQDIEQLTGCKVYLELFLKVKSDWRENTLVMKSLGYDTKNPE